jgi:hypothetical protein
VASRITGVPARKHDQELSRGRKVTTGTGPGRELEDGTRAAFESALGRDFSQVRVHTDTTASETALNMRAAAYTVGSHVYFAAGHFAPHTAAGSHLLAHELAHVLQNSDRGTPTLVRRAPLPAEVQNSADHKNLMYTIMTANWTRAGALLNAYNIDGIHSVFEDLSPRQIESLYLGAIANDAVGGGSNIAKEALAASPDLQTAIAAVKAAGISIKEFVDLASPMERGVLISRYGLWRYRTIRDAARSLPGNVLTHLLMAEDTTVYQHRSGRVGTIADERAQRLQEFKPHGVTGTAAGLGAGLVTKDPDKIEAAAATGDVVGDLGGAVAQTGAARAQNKDISAAGARQPDSSSLVLDKGGGKSASATPAAKGNYVSPKVGGPLPANAGVTQKPLPPVKFGTTAAQPRISTGAFVRNQARNVVDPFSGQVLGQRSASAQTARSVITAIRADEAEAAAWREALSRGEIGLEAPAGANVPGGDFYTAQVDANGQVTLIANDVKLSTIGKFPTPGTTVKPTWRAELQAAIGPGRLNVGDPALENAIRDAFNANRVRLRQLNADYSPSGGGRITGY